MKNKSVIDLAITIVLITLVVFTSYGYSCGSKEVEEQAEELSSGEEETAIDKDITEDKTKDEEEESGQTGNIDETKDQDDGKDDGPEGDIVEGYVYPAILKSIDLSKNAITVEQLINEPYLAEIGDTVGLDKDCKVIRIVVIRDKEEKEYSHDIPLKEVALNTEIGIIFKGNLVHTIISSFMLDTSTPLKVEEPKPLEGEYMAGALLKAVDTPGNAITVEQLINEPNEKIIDSSVKLADGCKVYKSILIRSDDDEGEREYTAEISINEIPLNTEIGIGFTKDNLARIIISQEWFQD